MGLAVKKNQTSNLDPQEIERRKLAYRNTIGFMRVAGHEIPDDMKPVWESWVKGEISEEELDEKIMQDVTAIAGKKVTV